MRPAYAPFRSPGNPTVEDFIVFCLVREQTGRKLGHTMPPVDVHLCLLHSDDLPATNPENLAFRFGLQDTRGVLVPPEQQPDGKLAFRFTLTAKPGRDPSRPSFTGRFASGPADDRFVYLSWLAVDRGDYINRVKARLSSIDWVLIHASQDGGRPITADMTGWTPHDNRKFVSWQLG